MLKARKDYWKKGADGQPGWRLAQVPTVSGAMVSLSPRDGALLALVGGYDYRLSKFNRAVQAERQPGSGFKASQVAIQQLFDAGLIINMPTSAPRRLSPP